ncbi:MAG: hypothetical protein ACREBI_03900, partial [Nitrosotalea sp.]
ATRSVTQPLTDSLDLTDSVSATRSVTQPLTDSLQLTDSINTFRTVTQPLSDSLDLTDSVSTFRTVTKSLSDSLPLTDTASTTKSATESLSDSLALTDTAATIASITQSLTDSLPITDIAATTRSLTQPLTDSLPITDTVNFEGEIKVEARDQNNNLIPGATYAISPNPNGGNTPETVIDGGTNDNDGKNNGRAVVTLAPFGPYTITMTTIPSGYNVLGNSTIHTVYNTNLNGITVFRLVPINISLATLPPIVTTSAPDLNGSTLGTWVSSFNAIKINGSTSTSVTQVQSLSPIISVGNSNSGLDTAISNQATVKLQKSFPSSASSSSIISSLGVPVYSMPKSSDLTTVLPSIVASASQNNPSQVVTTPPLDGIVPGQRMIIPVSQSVIPTTGGLKQLDIQSNPTSTSAGNAPSDWLVVHVEDQLPSSKPALPNNDKLALYVNVTYQYEETGQGFNWANPSNFATQPKMTLQLPKNPTGVTVDSNGCPSSDIFIYDPVHNSWTTNPVTILSETPTVGNSNTCDVVVQTQHFSQFAVGAHGIGSGSGTGTGSSSSSGSGGGAGSVGSGGSGAGAGTSSSGGSNGAFGGILAPVLKIDSVSYNLCQNDTVKILVEYSDSTPTVILRTSLTGTIQATLDQVQPFAQENQNSTIQKLVYVAQVDPKEQSFEAVALQAADNNVSSVGETVDVSGCEQTINYANPGATSAEQVQAGAPEIFDVKSQVGNGTEIPSSEQNQFTSSQPVKVSAIINSPTQPNKVQLRFVQAGSPVTTYSTVNMDVTPLQISNTTYAVSGTIPAEILQGPAVTYWVDAQNNAGMTTDSDQYTIGVKPAYGIAGNLEMDIHPTRAEGTASSPVAYFTNEGTGPIYGSVSLVVDGNVTYTSPSQIFGTGQTAVDLKWKTISIGKLEDHQVKAVANFYDKSFETLASPITTFPSVQSIALSQLSSIAMLNESNNTIAQPSILYSSFNNEGTMRYDVTAPDGTCVIGGSSDCLVQKSTFGLAGNLKSITIGDQIYRVRYSGPDSPLERFSITSVDPIVGTWHVGINSQQSLLPQAHAAEDVFLKVKYRDTNNSLVTLFSR